MFVIRQPVVLLCRVVLALAVAAHHRFGLAGLRSRVPAPCSLSSARNRQMNSPLASTVASTTQGRQAAAVLASTHAGQPDGQPAPKLKCIVIGAGFSGLAAARTLADEGPGVEVTVLEAGRRVGGRAHTAQVRSAMPVLTTHFGATGKASAADRRLKLSCMAVANAVFLACSVLRLGVLW